MTTVKNIYDYINSIAPFDLQEEWDNSGFLIGDFRREVKRVVLALDGTAAVCDFAVDMGADLLLTHHPLIFSGIKSVKKGEAVFELIENGIAVISAHTSFDRSHEGINHYLMKRLGLKNEKRVEDSFIFTGELEQEMSIGDFTQHVCAALGCASVHYTDTKTLIKKVAVCGGAGAEYISLAAENADCYVTGEAKYHEMLQAGEQDFAVVCAGHFETEADSFTALQSRLAAVFPDVEFITAPQKNPILAVRDGA